MGKIGKFVGVLFLLGMIGMCQMDKEKGSSGSAATSVANVERPSGPSKAEEEKKLRESAQVLSVADIKAAMEANEARFMHDVKDKWIRVSGRVDRIDEDFMGDPFIVIKDPKEKFDFIGAVHCHPESKEKAFDLKKGDDITISGIAENEVMGSLTIGRCDW